MLFASSWVCFSLSNGVTSSPIAMTRWRMGRHHDLVRTSPANPGRQSRIWACGCFSVGPVDGARDTGGFNSHSARRREAFRARAQEAGAQGTSISHAPSLEAIHSAHTPRSSHTASPSVRSPSLSFFFSPAAPRPTALPVPFSISTSASCCTCGSS